MAICRFFKMAAVRHIGFLKVGNFNSWSGSKAQYESPCQISQRSVKPFRRYGDFSIFQDGGRSPYWICCRHIGITHEKYLVVSITVLNLVFNRCSSLDKVDVLMFCVFGLKAPIHSPMAQYESLCRISQRSVKPFRRYGDFSIFQDGGRSPYWICCRHIGTTHEEYLVVSITVLNLVGIDAVVSTRWTF